MTELLQSRHNKGIQAYNLRKSFLVSLLNHIDNEYIALINNYFHNENENEYCSKMHTLSERVKYLEDEVSDKTLQLNRLKESTETYEILALEAEEAFNKKNSRTRANYIDFKSSNFKF